MATDASDDWLVEFVTVPLMIRLAFGRSTALKAGEATTEISPSSTVGSAARTTEGAAKLETASPSASKIGIIFIGGG